MYRNEFNDIEPGTIFINKDRTKLYEIIGMFSAYLRGTLLITRNLSGETNNFAECSYIANGKGGDYLDEAGNISVNNEKVAEALQIMKDMQEANAVSLVPGGNVDADEGYAAYNSGEFAELHEVKGACHGYETVLESRIVRESIQRRIRWIQSIFNKQ